MSFDSLNSEQLAKYNADGYLVIKKFFDPSTADSLKSRSDELVSEADLSQHPKTIFRTKHSNSDNKPKHAMVAGGAVDACDTDDYFLLSSDRVHFFFEEKAFDDEGNLVTERKHAINKIGHYLHVIDPLFNRFSSCPQVKQLARDIGFIAPIILQSMVICKQPRIGGEVTAHRDSTFLTTLPSTAVGFWFALEDCRLDNGCLAFVKGTHKDGLSTRRMVRSGPMAPSINNVSLRPRALPSSESSSSSSSSPSPASSSSSAPSSSSSSSVSLSGPIQRGVALTFTGSDSGLSDAVYPDDKYAYEPISKGDMICINGEVVHKSSENTSPLSRYIYTFHMIESYGDVVYPVTNWLQSAAPFVHLFTEEEEESNIKRAKENAK